METQSHYSVLKCDENASKTELKKQYKKLALETHPDKNGSMTSAEEFHKVDKAIKVLDNELTRRQYDSQLIENRTEKRIINDELLLNDLIYNFENDLYESECRCGGLYCICGNDLSQKTESFIIDCDSCSLSVKIKLK